MSSKDNNIIIDVLNLAMEAEQKYREMMVKEAEDRQKALTDRIKSKMIEKEPEVAQKKVGTAPNIPATTPIPNRVQRCVSRSWSRSCALA